MTNTEYRVTGTETIQNFIILKNLYVARQCQALTQF